MMINLAYLGILLLYDHSNSTCIFTRYIIFIYFQVNINHNIKKLSFLYFISSLSIKWKFRINMHSFTAMKYHIACLYYEAIFCSLWAINIFMAQSRNKYRRDNQQLIVNISETHHISPTITTELRSFGSVGHFVYDRERSKAVTFYLIWLFFRHD